MDKEAMSIINRIDNRRLGLPIEDDWRRNTTI